MSRPFWQSERTSKPADFDSAREAAVRRESLQSSGLTEAEIANFSVYEVESHKTPVWQCPRCHGKNMCSMSTCGGCQLERPAILHGDKDQGDPIEGIARRKVKGKKSREIVNSSEVQEYIKAWNLSVESNPDRMPLNEYLFDTERLGQPLLTWQEYVDFLCEGGSV